MQNAETSKHWESPNIVSLLQKKNTQRTIIKQSDLNNCKLLRAGRSPLLPVKRLIECHSVWHPAKECEHNKCSSNNFLLLSWKADLAEKNQLI